MNFYGGGEELVNINGNKLLDQIATDERKKKL